MNNDITKSGTQDENIQLSLPVNAAYVSAARLTASSIANRMLFDIDEIEDIKAAVSEACTFVIKNLPQDVKSDFKIVFSIKNDVLVISIGTPVKIKFESTDEEMSLVMIKALMDKFNYKNELENNFEIIMEKKHKAVLFD